ncbi:hypothetical protein Agub_g4423, partial [Astrephomene gubernaculifera]
MADVPITATQGYQPLTRMQEKAAQLRQELDAISKAERHAQFKRQVPQAGAVPSSPSSRRFPRPSTSIGHSPSTTHISISAFAAGSTGGAAPSPVSGGGGGGAAAAATERPPSASALTSRLSSRRASTASGVATDASGDEQPQAQQQLQRPGSSRRSLLAAPHGASSGGLRRGVRASRGAGMREMGDYAAAISRQNQLEDMVAELEDRVRLLSSDNERRQESYMRREEELRGQVAALEDQLRVARGERAQHPVFGKAANNIRELHSQVVTQIEGLLDAQEAALRSEEHSTLRRFTTRLGELEAVVAAEKGRAPPPEEADSLDRVRALRQELDNMQAIAQVLDKKHGILADENARLRSQFKLQEEDREYLIKQTVALKKENAALRNQLAAAVQEVTSLSQERDELLAAVTAAGGTTGGPGGGFGLGGGSILTPSPRPLSSRSAAAGGGGGGSSTNRSGVSGSLSAAAAAAAAGGGSASSSHDAAAIAIKIQRYEDVIDSLKRLLESERRRTKQARAAHTLELQQRTWLQGVVRQCVEDVREKRKALEAEAHREQLSVDRATARSRPVSALRPPPPSAAVARPLSAALRARPASPAITRTNTMAASAAAATARSARGGGGSGGGLLSYDSGGSGASAADEDCPPLSPSEREQLISSLLSQEGVLQALFERAFPGVAPHPPSDPYLERMAAWQEQREAQVVANAKVLAAAKNAVLPPATALKESTPGGLLIKEVATRPWILNVDAMLADFLGGGVGGG